MSNLCGTTHTMCLPVGITQILTLPHPPPSHTLTRVALGSRSTPLSSPQAGHGGIPHQGKPSVTHKGDQAAHQIVSEGGGYLAIGGSTGDGTEDYKIVRRWEYVSVMCVIHV